MAATMENGSRSRSSHGSEGSGTLPAGFLASVVVGWIGMLFCHTTLADGASGHPKAGKPYQRIPDQERLDPIYIYAEACEAPPSKLGVLKAIAGASDCPESERACKALRAELEGALKQRGIDYRIEAQSAKELGKTFNDAGEREIQAKYRMLLEKVKIVDELFQYGGGGPVYKRYCARVTGRSTVWLAAPRRVPIEAWYYGSDMRLTAAKIADRLLTRDNK
jgi:hypothetical protein